MSELKKFVFCEGKDDQSVLEALCDKRGIDGLQIEPFRGKDQLGEFLRKAKLRPEFSQGRVQSVAVIRDADASLDSAFQSVSDSLARHDFDPPREPGQVTSPSNGIRVGIFIIGPNNNTGMLEDLCLSAVTDKPGFPCIKNFFACVNEARPENERRGFSSKATVRAWMATQPHIDSYVGVAAQQGYWPFDHPAFEPLADFLRSL